MKSIARSKQSFSAILLVLLAFTFASCAGKPTSSGSSTARDAVPLAGTFKVQKFALANGLKILVVEDHSSPTFAYNTWFRVGSRDEVPGFTGLAHLFEHMMFKGTKTLKDGEFDRILESNGAEGENAFTSRDYTAYVQEMPKDKLELIARLEADRMVNLVVDDNSFKTERDVVQNERRFRTENNPDGLMYQEIFGLHFTNHPYHWPVIGYQADLDRMTAKEGRAFYETYYSPNHATIVVVGDANPGEVRSLIEKYYGKLPARASEARMVATDPVPTSVKRKQLPLNIQVEKLMMGFRIPPLVSEDTPAINVLQGILTEGKSSRLHRALVETGIASSVESYGMDDKDPSLFIFTANMQKGRKAVQAEKVILNELNKLVKNLASPSELERAKNRLDFYFYDGLNGNSDKANFLGKYEAVANDFELGIKMQKQISSVTAEQVQAVARKYLIPNSRTVITGIPKPATAPETTRQPSSAIPTEKP